MASAPLNIWFLLLALLAEILGTLSGFGSSLLFVPIASLFFDIKTVLGITAVFHVFSNLAKIAFFKEGIAINIGLKLGFPAIAAVAIGAYYTTFLPAALLTFWVNLIIALSAVLFFRKNHITLQSSNLALISGGIVSGFLAGIAGTGGAIRGLTLAAFGLPKLVFVATSAIIDLGVDATRAGMYLHYGYFPSALWKMVPYLILISLLGSYIGKRLLLKISENQFQKMVLILICSTCLFSIFKFLLR